MLCQNCQTREATVHFTHIINNKKIERYICDQCAREQGQGGFNITFNINDFLSSIMGAQESSLVVNSQNFRDVCSNCGMNFEEFRNTGKMGCGKCYENFEENLSVILRRIHGNERHQGKVPEKISDCIKITTEVKKLKEELNKYIKKEEYEKAAEIRDKIKAIESEMTS